MLKILTSSNATALAIRPQESDPPFRVESVVVHPSGSSGRAKARSALYQRLLNHIGLGSS